MSSSLSTATPVRHIKASFLHGRDGGKAGQVAVAAAAIANSIAQQQQQSQPPHQPKRPSVGEGTATTTTSTSTKSTSHRNGLAGQSTTTTTAAAAAAAKSEPREAASSSADLSTITGFSSSPSFSSSASVSPVLVNGAASAELNGDDIISSTSDTTDLAPSPPPALPPPPVDDNNNNNKSITTTATTNHLSNGNSAGEENGGTITTTNPLKVPPKPKPRPSTLNTTATTNKPLKWPPPLKSPKSPRKTTSAASSFNFAAATASVKHHNFGRSKSHQRPPIPRKPSFLRKKRPQSAFCNSTAESGSSTSDSTEVVNGEHDDFEEEEYEESEVILEDSNDDQPQQQNGFSSSTTCTQTSSSSSPSPSSSSSSSNSATVNSSVHPHFAMSSTHRSQEVLPFAQQSQSQQPSSSSTAATNSEVFPQDFSTTVVETTSDTDSHDSKSRPLKVGDLSQAPNTEPTSVEPPFTKVKDLRVSSKSPTREHSGVLGGVRLKSDSLDSSRAACCTNLAFNFYNKAVESAKKALPKHKSKEYPHFPRSFGEDFGSIGPDAFNYLDDSMTECSISYKDIDFNRDSYYGGEVIPEETALPAEVGQLRMDEEKPAAAENLTGESSGDPPEPMPYPGPVYGNPYNPAYYFTDEPSGSDSGKKDQPSSESKDHMIKASSEEAEENKRQLQKELFGAAVSTESLEDGKKKSSFIGKIFRKRDRSVDKDTGANKENKKEKAKRGKSPKKSSASQSRECSMDKSRESSRGRSLPPATGNEPVEDTERSLIEELDRRTPSPSPGRAEDDNVMHFSNISRQSPVNIVYTRPPDIFVEEVRTLPRDADELASHTSQMILADVLNSMNSGNERSSGSPVTYANLDFSSGVEEFAVAPGTVVGKDGKPKKDFKAVILPKGFFRKLSGKGKSPGPSEGRSGGGEPTGPVVIVVDDVVASVVNVPPFQTEEELLGKPLPDLPGSKSHKSSSGDGTKPKARLFLKKENFKLKDRFKKKKKQKEGMQEAVARRQLPTLPESKHSTLNSGGGDGSSHLYDRIGLNTPTAERRQKQQQQTDEYGNVLLDIGKPLEPGVDYFSPEYAPEEPEEEEEEVLPKSSSLYAQHPPELKSSYESLELPATTKPASPPPKVIEMEAKTADFDPTAIAFDSHHPIIIGQIALFEKMENVADREIGVTYEPAVIEFLEPPEEHDIGGSSSGKPGKMDKLKNMMGSLGQSVRAKVKDIKEKVKKHDHEQPQQEEFDQFEQSFARVSKSPHRDSPYVMVDVMPTLKETNLDEEFPADGGADHYVVQQQQQQSSSFSFRTFAPIEEETASALGTLPPPPESPVRITVEEVPTTTEVVTYEVDADLEEAAVDMTPESKKKKKVFRKFKLTKKGSKKRSGGGSGGDQAVEETLEYSVERRDVITPDRNEYALRPMEFGDEEEEEEKPSWSSRNKERIRRLRARAAESFKGVKERIAAQAGKLGGKKSPDSSARGHHHDPEAYQYEFKFDSEQQPGLDARQQKVYQDLAEAQERLELYMSPVGTRGPLRPPRSNAVKQYSPQQQQQQPQSSSVSMSGRKLPPPPRPPPPKRLPGGSYPLHSYHSVPAIEVGGGEGDEISLSTSMSSLWAAGQAASNARSARSRSVRAANSRHYHQQQQQQRVPADIYYRNVRLGYRPKKSYVELLEKSAPFYSVANLNRSFSLGQLPVPPTRNKYKQQQQQQQQQSGGQFLTARSIRATTSPPPPPSRASMASGTYGEVPGGALALTRHGQRAVTIEPVELDADLQREKELYEVYDHHSRARSPPPAADGDAVAKSAPADPLAWQPFSWKVKRCRSLTEIDVRGEARMKQARCSVEPPDDDPRNNTTANHPPTSEYSNTVREEEDHPNKKEHPEENTYSSRLLSWLTSTTSLDTWRRVKRDRSVPSKPPRPPPPSRHAQTSSRPSSPTASSSAVAFYYPSLTDASRSSSVATLTQQSAATITGAYPNYSASTPARHLPSSHYTGRPLPPPPVPPRPRLIPAHYALQNRSKPAVETRDAAVDTSENGFHEYHLSEKEVQVKLGLAARTPGHSLLSSSQDSADSAELLNCGLPPVATAALRSFEETNLDDDEEPTIVDDKVLLNRLPNTADFSEYSVKDDEISEQVPEDDNRADTLNTATSASVYEDARSRLTGQLTTTTSQRQQAANHAGAAAPHEPYELSDNDDDTINDELSSFASEYQSFCSSVRSEPHSTAAAAGALGAAPFAEPEPGLSPVPPQSQTTSVSWLHRQHPPTTTTTDQPQQTQSVSTDKHTIGGNTSTTEEEYLTAMDGPGPASNRSSLISNDPMLEEEEMEEARHQATGMSFDDFRRTFANSMVVSGVGADGDDEEEPAGGASTSAASAAANNNNNNNSSGQAMSADAKRFNRQSVISTISSASSDTSSSIFHTHSSSPSSSYSFDSSASLTSIPQAHISSIASTSSTSTSKRSSVFYTNVTAPIAAAVEAAEEAMQSEVSEVTRTSDLGTSVASSSVTVSAVAEGGQVLVEDGCVPSKLATSSSSLGEVVVLSPNPQSLPENLSRLPSATPKGSEPTKEYYLAYEMWLTERDYVDVLQMLTKEFREAVQGTVNGYFLNKFFRPLDQVLPINERLLKELEQRVLVDWDDNPKISDIMIKICPFFKEYSIFVREFDQLNHMLDEASELFPDFNAALTAFQRTDRCKKLSIKNYLLKPIQRLPQYPLLITTYLKKLKSDDPDYENTQRALKVVTEVVEHVNRESHQAEKALKLAELKNRIISKTPDAIVKPGRELIKEGPLLKISRKEVQERYFILFNDALLYLVPVMNEMIRLNEEFPLDGMEVDISNQSDREFVIRSMRRSFALMARSKDERAAWVEALEGAIAENDAKKNSFETARGHSNSCGNSSSYSSLDRRSSSPHRSASRLQDSFSSDHHHHHHHDLEHSPSMSSTDEHHHHSTPEGPHHQSLHHQPSSASTTSSASIETARRNTNPNNAVSTLGERAPVWVHDYRVSMCQGCMREFTIFFRRHHCRACGSVVCSDCSTHHYPLRYRKMEPQRVCDNCYQTLSTLHPEWLNGGGGGGGNSGHGNGTGGTPTGSNRVSPNNSLSAADAAALKRKSRSNSCTHLDDSFNWANGPENGGSGGGGGLHNQSLPVGGTILEQQDQNHNPTSSGSLLSPSTLVRGPIRFSSRFARKNIPAVLVEVQANDASCKQSGFMYRLSAKKSWKRFWFVIKEMVLYTYRASEDVAALESLPLPGFKVATSKEAIKGYPAALIIELSHPGQSTIYFFTENPEAHQRWLKAFRECAELH